MAHGDIDHDAESSLARRVLTDASSVIDGRCLRYEIFAYLSNDDLFAVYCAWVTFKKTFENWPQDDAAAARSARPPRSEYIVRSLATTEWALAFGWRWPVHACELVANIGNLAVLQLARQHMCPWSKHTCASAAEGGHLEVLQWARAQGCPWDKMTCAYAAKGGHLEVLADFPRL